MFVYMDKRLRDLKAYTVALGFNRIGIIPAQPARRLNSYLQWIADGHHGAMDYMARPDRIVRRQDLNVILPGIKAIICVGLDYFTRSIPPEIAEDPSRGRISNYAWGSDYHDLMAPRLEKLAAWLKAVDPEVKTRVYVDTGAILERDHAETAGLGFTGKNSMLIAPKSGSWHFLGELLTTLPLVDDSPRKAMPGCGSCRSCLDACPTSAFTAPYIVDARRCISYLTIELKDWIPSELRPIMGNWVYGCDVCQDVCPFNRFAQPVDETNFWPGGWDDVAPPLIELLALGEDDFNLRFAGSPIKRMKRHRLVRNAAVAAGNWGSEMAVPFLKPLLQDFEPIVRGHAAWALQQIGGAEARNALAHALRQEPDESVIRELKGLHR
jgi:epoxyqueuosine reductase